MRNLKKILALVLALTMVLGLSISAGAGTFTDVNEDDDYAAAIELLASLDVLAGMGDGTYNAAGSYTREQFTKILYVLVTGKDDGAAMYTEVAPFPDVAADRWSAGYINWAVQLGILVGRDDGLFHPTDVVNYAEACKMFLIAMGYSASMYTYPYGFIDKADSLKLFDDISGYATYAPANRGTVAQMGYNALFAEAPRFGTYTAKEGDTTETRVNPLITGAFGVDPFYAVLAGTSTNASDSIVYGDDQVALVDPSTFGLTYSKTLDGVFNYVGDVDALIGMQVKVWAREDENSLSELEIILVEDAGKSRAYDINPYDVIELDASDEDRVAFKDGEATRRLKLDSTLYHKAWDGALTAGEWVAHDLTKVTTTDPDVDGFTDPEVTYHVIDIENDGDIDTIVYVKPDFARITALSDDKVSLSAGYLVGSNDIMDDEDVVVALEDGLAKDDYVLVFPRRAVIGNSADDAFAVVKAPVVEAVKLTRQSGTGEYDYYADEPVRYAYNETTVELGNTYNLYLNQNGFIAKAVELEDEANENWILATDYYNNVSNVSSSSRDSKLFGAQIIGYLPDGSKKTFSIDIDEVEFICTDNEDEDDHAAEATDVLFDADNATWPGWQPEVEDDYILFAYTLDDNGVIDSLKYVSGDVNDLDKVENFAWDADFTNTVNVGYSTTTTLLRETTGNVGFITDKTVIYNIDGDDVSVLTADEMIDIDIDDGDHTYRQAGIKGGNIEVVVIDGPISATSYKYALLISGIKNDVSSTKANYTVTALVDGEKVELTTKNVDKADSTKGLFEGGLANGNLRTKAGDPVIGYARLTLNASGKISKIWLLDSTEVLGADPAEDAGTTKFVDGNAYLVKDVAVTAIPSNGKGVSVRPIELTHEERVGTDEYKCFVDGIGLFGTEYVIAYASDVNFYTVGHEPCAGVDADATNDPDKYKNNVDFYGATASSLLQSTLVKGINETDVAQTVDSDDNVFAIDVIMAWDDKEDKELAKAVFIYTTPVSGREGVAPGTNSMGSASAADSVDLSKATVTFTPESPTPYTVGMAFPVEAVTLNGNVLNPADDYTVEWAKNGTVVTKIDGAAIYDVTITAKAGSGYTGTKKVSYTVGAAETYAVTGTLVYDVSGVKTYVPTTWTGEVTLTDKAGVVAPITVTIDGSTVAIGSKGAFAATAPAGTYTLAVELSDNAASPATPTTYTYVGDVTVTGAGDIGTFEVIATKALAALTGTVKLNDEVQPGLTVNFESEDIIASYDPVVTDKDGKYTVNLPEGNYTVSVEVGGELQKKTGQALNSGGLTVNFDVWALTDETVSTPAAEYNVNENGSDKVKEEVESAGGTLPVGTVVNDLTIYTVFENLAGASVTYTLDRAGTKTELWVDASVAGTTTSMFSFLDNTKNAKSVWPKDGDKVIITVKKGDTTYEADPIEIKGTYTGSFTFAGTGTTISVSGAAPGNYWVDIQGVAVGTHGSGIPDNNINVGTAGTATLTATASLTAGTTYNVKVYPLQGKNGPGYGAQAMDGAPAIWEGSFTAS